MSIKYVELYDGPYPETANRMLVQTAFPVGFIIRSAEELDCSAHFGGVWEKIANENINGITVFRYKRIR